MLSGVEVLVGALDELRLRARGCEAPRREFLLERVNLELPDVRDAQVRDLRRPGLRGGLADLAAFGGQDLFEQSGGEGETYWLQVLA